MFFKFVFKQLHIQLQTPKMCPRRCDSYLSFFHIYYYYFCEWNALVALSMLVTQNNGIVTANALCLCSIGEEGGGKAAHPTAVLCDLYLKPGVHK